MIHVVHLVLGLDVGGLERVVLRLVERTDPRRFKVSVCALTAGGRLMPELGRTRAPLAVIQRRRGLDPVLVARLARHFSEQGADLIHTHNPAPHLYGALAGALVRARSSDLLPRVIHTKHGRNHPDSPRKVLLERVASALTDKVVAVSDEAREVVARVERVAPSKLATIHNGVDPAAFRPHPDKIEARRRLGLEACSCMFGCVARLSAEKDHMTLLGAFAQVVARAPGARLCVVGDGPMRAALERRSRELHLEDRVDFLGMRSDIAALMGAFDAFVLASRTEGISLTLLEAAATGLPIIATDVGGNSEILRANKSGWLVPVGAEGRLAEAMLRCYHHEDRPSMGIEGRAHVIEQFSEDAMVRAYESLYTETYRQAAHRAPGPARWLSGVGGGH